MSMSSDRTYHLLITVTSLIERNDACRLCVACLLALSAVLLQVSDVLRPAFCLFRRPSQAYHCSSLGYRRLLRQLRCTEACWSKRREECTSHQVRRRASIAPVLSPIKFPSWHRETVGPQLSSLMLYTFFAAVGASARIETLTSAGPAVLAFTAITLVVHVTVLSFGAAAANRLKKSLSTSSHRRAERWPGTRGHPQARRKQHRGGSSRSGLMRSNLRNSSPQMQTSVRRPRHFPGLIGRPPRGARCGRAP